LEQYILPNKLKLIYEKSNTKLTSICISINAGAAHESTKLGVAHATEHMVYKGTIKRSEKDINRELSSLFGMQNAMTNYPYVIYYGTLLDEDFANGLELFSDILQNPTFSEQGFKEEMAVIKEELKEWDEELDQYCEDKLFFNSFESSRLKYPIIGTLESLDSITLEDIKVFYKEKYQPGNVSIAVVSGLSFDNIKEEIKKYFGDWLGSEVYENETSYVNPLQGTFVDNKIGINS
jgi:predicted Zn-dependent peptidase